MARRACGTCRFLSCTWSAKAAAVGAKACHLHGGVMDARLAAHRMEEAIPLVARIRELGMLAGVAGHNTGIFFNLCNHLFYIRIV